METGIAASLKEQGMAVLLMMSLAIVSVLAMIVLDVFGGVVSIIPGLGNGTAPGSANVTIHATLTLFIVAFGLFGSFASITALVILTKGIIGVVRGLN